MKKLLASALVLALLAGCVCTTPPVTPPTCAASPVCVQDAQGQPPQPKGYACGTGATCDGAGLCCK